jgi:hypothetical protein
VTIVIFVPKPSASEVDVAVGKLRDINRHVLDQIPAELIQARGETLLFEIRKLIQLIWSKEELLQQRKVSIVVPVHKKGDKSDCSKYRGISLLSTSYIMLSKILISRLTPYAEEIIGDRQCGF